jgi:glycosyltransferase involved in cell wall biosynthesis
LLQQKHMIPNKNIVSVLIVAYNAEKFILQTVKSCLNQTYKNIEILILDNASSDGTVKIIESIADKRIKNFRSESNLGPYSGLNFLLEKSQSEYVAIQDHDDIWFPDKIRKQVEFMNKNLAFVACGTNNYNFYEKIDVLILNKKPFVSIDENYVPHSSLMFRNKGFRYNPEKTLADEYFEKKILLEHGKIFLIEEALTIHRIRMDGKNLSKKRFKVTLDNVREFFDINKIGYKSLVYFFSLLFLRVFNDEIRLFIEFKIFKRNNLKIKLKDFRIKFKDVSI